MGKCQADSKLISDWEMWKKQVEKLALNEVRTNFHKLYREPCLLKKVCQLLKQKVGVIAMADYLYGYRFNPMGAVMKRKKQTRKALMLS